MFLERFALANVAEVERESLHGCIVGQVAADYLEHVAIGTAFDAQFDWADGASGGRSDFGEERPQPLAVIASPEVEQVFSCNRFGTQAESTLGGGRSESQSTVHGDDHDDV